MESSIESDSDSEVKPKNKIKGRRSPQDLMPIKKLRRIFTGTVLTLLVVSPLIVSIVMRTSFDDSTRYVFHQVLCSSKKNEARVIKVSIEKI